MTVRCAAARSRCNFPASGRFPASDTQGADVEHAECRAGAARPHARTAPPTRASSFSTATGSCARLGAGGMGVVYLARDEHLERDVAVKRIAIEHDRDGRGEREALAAARLSHPGIVALYESGRDDDAVYLVSELVARAARSPSCCATASCPTATCCSIGVTLCDALEHAHARGVDPPRRQAVEHHLPRQRTRRAASPS